MDRTELPDPGTPANENDPRERDPATAQDLDPASGASDDPRVDPTPDARVGPSD